MEVGPRGILTRLPGWIRRIELGLVLLGLAVILIEQGFGLPLGPIVQAAASAIYRVTVFLFAVQLGLSLSIKTPLRKHRREFMVDGALLLLALALLHDPRSAFAVIAARQILVGTRALASSQPLRPWLSALEARPMRMVAVSFLGAIAVGMAFLSLPAASASGTSATAVDALFTSTSAVCVTGLTVRSTPDDWSLFGQIVILCLIQVGGLGIMVLSVSVVMLLGHRLRVRQQAAMAQALDTQTASGLHESLRYLLFLTVAFEAAGAVILSLRFGLETSSWTQAVWLGVFHSVSAWNNAGFGLWNDSLMSYSSDLIVNLTVIGLVIAGGLGFAVLGQLFRPDLKKGASRSSRRWSTHTRLVLITSGILLAGGTLSILFVEFDNGLAGLALGEKILAALFQSASARTAGFNTVDLATFSPLGLLLIVVLMYIGASPGSTGGGIKTSTVAVLYLAVRALVLNRDDVEVFHRRILPTVILRVMGIVVVSATVVLVFLTLMLALEPGRPFVWLLFETMSAFGTVGLSTGITPTLSAETKLLLVALMFIGRIGPLSLALAFQRTGGKSPVQYPEASVVVG